MPTQPSEAERALLYFRTVIRSNLRNCNAVREHKLGPSAVDSLAMRAAAAVVAALTGLPGDDAPLELAPEWATAWAKKGLEPA